MLPSWPGWDAAHPLIVHFPVALLMVAPLFVLLAIVAPKHAACLGASAFVLMLLGTIAAFVAVETGEATAEFALKTDAITKVLDRHKELAGLTRNVFTALTALYALVLLLPRLSRKAARPAFRSVANVVMLALLGAGALLVANTGHLGGRLVHELGVRAMWPQAPATAPSNPDSGR
jgi:uncharacterized membrane protein